MYVRKPSTRSPEDTCVLSPPDTELSPLKCRRSSTGVHSSFELQNEFQRNACVAASESSHRLFDALLAGVGVNLLFFFSFPFDLLVEGGQVETSDQGLKPFECVRVGLVSNLSGTYFVTQLFSDL